MATLLRLRNVVLVLIGFAAAVASVDSATACPGCCSSHGGIVSACASNGRTIFADGTVSPSGLAEREELPDQDS